MHAHIFTCFFKVATDEWQTTRRAEERRRSGGCIVRESKGGVIRPNGSQMAGCQWREKRDELLIGTRRTQTPLNCRWEREKERERIKRGMGRALWLNNWQRETRGSEEESVEERKVVSPEQSSQYEGVSVQICQGSHSYLSVSLSNTDVFLHLPYICFALTVFYYIYPGMVCRAFILLFFSSALLHI